MFFCIKRSTIHVKCPNSPRSKKCSHDILQGQGIIRKVHEGRFPATVKQSKLMSVASYALVGAGKSYLGTE